MKKRRQAKILEIISKYETETQEDLQKYLHEAGFEVTQATISRDIKELRLVKAHSADGKYVYSTGKHPKEENFGRTAGIFNEAILKVQYAMNTVCIKCFSGMANSAMLNSEESSNTSRYPPDIRFLATRSPIACSG